GRGCLANQTLAILSKFFNWLIARDQLAASPVTGVERPHKEKARERLLNDAELRALLLAANSDNPFDRALWLLTLTGCRRNEVSRMEWGEIDEQRWVWTIPAERSKNHREHAVPFSTQARKIIEAMPRFAGCKYVFTVNGHRPINGWAKAKTKISAR